MTPTLDEQLRLHDAAGLCGVALLRPAAMAPETFGSILGVDLRRDSLIEALAPALATAWPDRPDDVTDLEGFLRAANSRLIARALALAGVDGVVPAGLWTHQGRELLLEHLHLDIAMLVGGVRAEGLWTAFGELPDTEPLGELIVAGTLIKLRAVGAFLVAAPSTHKDELTASEFFAAGNWEDARDAAVAQEVIQKPIHKQVAHLTVSRPLPDELAVYRPSSYRPPVVDLLTLLEQFVAAVDERLLPDGWRDSITSLRKRLDPADWPPLNIAG